MKNLLIFALHVYRKCISPFFPPTCRFYPSCSQYAVEAIETYGSLKGIRAALKRLLKCHPYHPGGYDPLSEPRKNPDSGFVDSAVNSHSHPL